MSKKNASRVGKQARSHGRPEEGGRLCSSSEAISFGKAARLLVIGTTGAGKTDMAVLRALAGMVAPRAPQKGKG